METKNFNEFFDELNDMANFKNFGETIKDKEFIDNPVIAYEELKAENERLKEELTELEEKFLTLNCKSYSYLLTLQEIKDYLNTLSGIDNDFVNTETYLRILDLITKAEVE